MFQWRRFQFFDKTLLIEEPQADAKTPASSSSSASAAAAGVGTPLKLFQTFDPSCSSSGRGHLAFGDTKGAIRIVDRDLRSVEYQAYESDVIALHQLKRSNILVSIGNDAVDNTTIKFWRLDKEDADGKPLMVRSLKVFNKQLHKVPITSFSVLEDLSQLAIGLGNGAVLLFEGNMLRDRSPEQRVIQKEGPCITGVHFREDSNSVCLFVVSVNDVTTYFTKTKQLRKTVIDNEGGAELTCSVVTEDKMLVVAREHAVYFYEPEEKSICFGFEGTKRSVGWFNSYLWVVCDETSSSARDAPITRNSLTIYDLKNKFIAFTAKFDAIVNIVAEWGSIFVLTQSHKAFQLQEKDLPTKMNMLFKKNLYSIAISLAHSQDCDAAYIKEIFQMYGDHLYSKGDYDAAISQYVETIPTVEPSYVIRKFLDAQRIHNLTRYLEALHEQGHANTNHTTLLLNCYTKLKDVEKLDQFIKSDNGLTFDAVTAIQVCRQAGYPDHALHLAQKRFQHDLYLQIQLNDVQNYGDALKYIWSLDFTLAEKYMREYGKTLVTNKPVESTELLKQLCSSYTPKRTRDNAMVGITTISSRSFNSTTSASPPSTITESKETGKARADEFIHFFVGSPAQLRELLEFVVSVEPKSSTVVYNTLLELYMRQFKEELEAPAKPASAAGAAAKAAAPAPASGPTTAEKIMALLKSPHARYDMDHALVLSKTHKFGKGVIFLYERLRLYNEIVQYHMDKGAYEKVTRACSKYGDQDPSLWIQALSYFANLDGNECRDQIALVLENIERKNLLPPLRVVQILASNPTKPLDVIKNYIVKTLQSENAVIQEDEKTIAQLHEETQRMRKEIDNLTSGAVTFQGTKCHACTSALELPAVHFLCNHSYHQRCMGENDMECMKCAPDYRKVMEKQSAINARAKNHDDFFKRLEDSRDGFNTVAEYFGLGIFQQEAVDKSKLTEADPDGDTVNDSGVYEHL